MHQPVRALHSKCNLWVRGIQAGHRMTVDGVECLWLLLPGVQQVNGLPCCQSCERVLLPPTRHHNQALHLPYTQWWCTLLMQQFIKTVLRFNSIFLFHAFVVLPIRTRKEIMANVFLKLLKVQYVSILSRACIEITVLMLGIQLFVVKRIY